MPATPRRARKFGGSSAHQKLMMANLAASLIAAEAIETTEAFLDAPWGEDDFDIRNVKAVDALD